MFWVLVYFLKKYGCLAFCIRKGIESHYKYICRFFFFISCLDLCKDLKKSKSTRGTASQRNLKQYKLSTQLKYSVTRNLALYQYIDYKFFFKYVYSPLLPNIGNKVLAQRASYSSSDFRFVDSLVYTRLENYFGYFSFLSFPMSTL